LQGNQDVAWKQSITFSSAHLFSGITIGRRDPLRCQANAGPQRRRLQKRDESMKKEMIAGMMLTVCLSATASAADPAKPSPEQARAALSEMFGDAKMFARAQVVLGTCLPVANPPNQGQISCTLTLLTPGAGSETQADFYLKSGHWTSEPATRQDLPFPDPKLMSVHWVPPAK
jgi:hypothetical protein